METPFLMACQQLDRQTLRPWPVYPTTKISTKTALFVVDFWEETHVLFNISTSFLDRELTMGEKRECIAPDQPCKSDWGTPVGPVVSVTKGWLNSWCHACPSFFWYDTNFLLFFFEKLVSYQKKCWHGHECPSFIWYDTESGH